MFNIPVYTRLIGVPHILIGVALYPILFILLLKIIYSKHLKDTIKLSIYFALLSMFVFTADPSLIVIYSLTGFLVVLLHIIIDRKTLNFKILVAGFSFVVLFTILMNLWWTTPFLEEVFGSKKLVSGTIVHPHNIEVFKAANNLVSFFDNIRLHWTKGGFSARAPDGTPYFSPAYIKKFYNTSFSYLLFLLFLAAGIYISFKSKENQKQVIIITAIGLIATFFSLGTRFPVFGKIHEFLFYNVPGFQVLRNFYKFQFIVLIWYVSLLALLCNYFFSRYKSTKSVLVISFLSILFIILNSLPLTAKNLAGRHEFFKLPAYYLKARSWLSSQYKDIYRILVIPQGTWEETYEWGPKFELVPIHRNFFKNSILLLQEPDEVKKLIEPVEKLKVDDLNKYLSLLNVRYVLIRKDIYEPNLTQKNRSLIKKLPGKLKNQGIFLEGSFGKLDFYKVSPRQFLPHIYAANTLTYLKGGINDLPILVALDNFQTKSAIILSSFPGNQKEAKVLKDASISIVSFSSRLKASFLYHPSLQQSTDIHLGKREADLVEVGDNLKLEIPKKAKYGILVKKDSLLGRSKDLLIRIGEKEISTRPYYQRGTSRWIKAGEVVLRKGEYPLGLVTEGLKVFAMEAGDLVLKMDDFQVELPLPKINFRRINPTKYVVSVAKAQGPYNLVFLENFHPGWKAYIKSVRSEESGVRRGKEFKNNKRSSFWETWFKKPLPESKHFLVNGYANGWQIEKLGDYEIILEFSPQQLFYMSLMISGLTLLGSLYYLGYDLRSRGKLKKRN